MMYRRSLRTVAIALVLAVSVAACAGGTTDPDEGTEQTGPETTGTTGAPETEGRIDATGALSIAVFHPFTGVDADHGTTLLSGCLAGIKAVNDAGGVLEREVVCEPQDIGTSPTEAVPAANQMLSTVSNLIMTVGPSNFAPPTTPIIGEAGIVMFAQAGDPLYNTSADPYFWRLTPADDLNGTAMAYWAYNSGITRAVAVFADTTEAQTQVPAFKSTYEALGGELLLELSLTPEQSSYRTEVARLLEAAAEGVVTELDVQTGSTFWSEVLQQAGELPRIHTDEYQLSVEWLDPVTEALGAENLVDKYTATGPAAPSEGEAIVAFQDGIDSISDSLIPEPERYREDPFSASGYDSVIIAALAMTHAGSAEPRVWVESIRDVTGPESDDVTSVSTYAEGLQALEQGENIVYVGTSGQVVFDEYRSNSGGFTAYRYEPLADEGERLVVIGDISAEVLADLRSQLEE